MKEELSITLRLFNQAAITACVSLKVRFLGKDIVAVIKSW